MGPSEDRSSAEKNQAGQRRIRHPRSRACLLKGCELRFRPVHPLTRYCSEKCREEARRWREWKARHRYRHSAAGKQKRQAQSRRYRMRCKRVGANRQPGKPREGHRKKNHLAAGATARAAMRASSGADAHLCNAFARMRVGGLWSGFWNGNGAGENANARRQGNYGKPAGPGLGCRDQAEMVLRYCASSGGMSKFSIAQPKEEGGTEARRSPCGFVLSSSMLSLGGWECSREQEACS